MDGFSPFWFTLTFFLLLWSACRNGEKTSSKDKDIDDYWSDG